METTSSNSLNMHVNVLPAKTRKALEFLADQVWLKGSNWYLAGGTALALQARHRESVDLDFFTHDKDFDNNELLGHFAINSNWRTDIDKRNTVYGELFGAKVSFIAYPFFIPSEKQLVYGSINILTPADIAVMKIIAISQRGRKRDFVDLYWLAQNGYPLEDTVRKLKTQYPSVAHDYHHILKSLVYFEDAESDPDPIFRFDISWKEIKSFFIRETPAITEKVIGLPV
jgi:predicted nucleotidyltransferase component of viral defense system